MNNLLKVSMISAATAVVLSMTGCGGSSSSNGDTNSTSGKAVDGYIKAAKVCLDLNGNGKCEAGEPYTETSSVKGKEGSYKLGFSDEQAKKAATDANVSIIVYGGTDIDTNKSLVGSLQAPYEGNVTHITPLTTLAVAMVKSGEVTSVNAAFTKVATVLGLTETQLKVDPIAYAQEKNDSKILAKAVVLHNMVASLADSNKTDDVYKAVAKKVATSTTKVTSVAKLVRSAASELNLSTTKKAALDDLVTTFEAQETLISKAEGNTSAIKNYVKEIAKVVTAAQDNNTSEIKNLAKDVEKEAKAVIPTLSFAKIGLEYNSTEGNTTELNASTLTDYIFADINITKSKDLNLTDFNLTLADINITKAFSKQTADLNIKVVDDSNASKTISLSIPGIVIEGNTTDLNISIPKDANATFKQTGDINITESNTTNFIFENELSFIESNSTINIPVLDVLQEMNVSSSVQDNLNKYFDKNRTYDLSIKFNGIDNTQLIAPTSINGKVQIINNK